MIDLSMPSGIEYKPGVEYYKAGGKIYLEQNPFSGSIFAKAAAKGMNIHWLMDKPPVAGEKLAYQGDMLVNGEEVSKPEGTELVKKFLA